eukprot:gene10196-11244_t
MKVARVDWKLKLEFFNKNLGKFYNWANKIVGKRTNVIHGSFANRRPHAGVAGNPGIRPPVAASRKVSTHDKKSHLTPNVRSNFPETWIWIEDRSDPKTGRKKIQAKVPDTMTTWYANAFALSSQAGIGVSSPAGLLVFQPFFVSLTLPYAVIRGETVKVPATVFNYLESCLTIRLSLEASDDFKASSYSSKVCVCGGKSTTFNFRITPAKIGKTQITVRAISTSENVCASNDKMAQSVGAADAVRRMLRVEPEGIKKEYSINSLFCPHKDGKGTYSESFQLKLPSPIVEGSVFARISVYGDLMGPSLTDLDKLLAMPYGCGEQNMVKFAPNIYIMQYLKNTNQLTKDIEDKAKEYMVSGYQRELTYKRSDGSYSAFGENDAEGSTWLSAFVLKSYAQAKPYIFIDDNELKDTMSFLLKMQKSDGCFKEVGMVHNKRLKGGISSGISMTAYVLSALIEAGLSVDALQATRALQCISSGIDKISDSYSAAILAYTLTLANSPDRSKVMKKLDSLAKVKDGLKYWEEDETVKETSWYYAPRPADVEMTAYALMAYITGPKKSVIGAAPILKWLSKQRNSLGGFSSTQDTCVALQALAQYGAEMYEAEAKMDVTISADQITHSFSITHQNRLVLQRVELPVVPTTVNVVAKGKGCGLLQANVKYNVPVVKEVPKFFLSIKAIPSVGAKCRHELRICASYMGKSASNMALIDVKMVSGFEPITEHIKKMIKSKIHKNLKDYEFENGVVSFYFNKIDSKTCIAFPVEETSVVLDRKKAYAKVYDYYNTGDFATAMYSVDKCITVN